MNNNIFRNYSAAISFATFAYHTACAQGWRDQKLSSYMTAMTVLICLMYDEEKEIVLRDLKDSIAMSV